MVVIQCRTGSIQYSMNGLLAGLNGFWINGHKLFHAVHDFVSNKLPQDTLVNGGGCYHLIHQVFAVGVKQSEVSDLTNGDSQFLIDGLFPTSSG